MTKVHTKRCIVKIYLFLLLVLLACGEYEPDNPGPPYCADPPIVNILDFLPSIHNVSLSGTVSPPDIKDAASTIPTGHTVIVVKFDGNPCDLRVTNLQTATYLVREWYWDDLHPNWLLIEVYAPKTGGLVHFAVEWHSGGIIAKYVSQHF